MSGDDPEAPLTPLDTTGMLSMFLSMIGGAIHVAVLDPGRPD